MLVAEFNKHASGGRFTPVGLRPFVQLAAIASAPTKRRFRKEVLRTGTWQLVDGRTLNVDSATLDRIVTDTNEWIRRGHSVNFPDGHTESALAVLGRWESFAREGDSIFGVLEVLDDEAAGKVGKTIREVSIGLSVNVLDPASGERLELVLEHVAATPYPVIEGQQNFVPLARRVGSDVEGSMADTPKPDDAKKDEKPAEKKPDVAASQPPSDFVRYLAQKLGLPEGADENAVRSAVESLCDEADTEQPEGTEAVMALSRKHADELEKLKGEFELSRKTNDEIKKEFARSRREGAERELEIHLSRGAQVGVLLEKEERDEVLGLLASETEKDRAIGRRILGHHLARVKDREEGQASGALRPIQTNTEQAEDKKAREAQDKAAEAMTLSRGGKPRRETAAK